MLFSNLLTKYEKNIFNQIYTVSKKLNIEIYVVGGFVRDKILNRDTTDIDFTCVGDGLIVANNFKDKFYPNYNINVFKNFGTAHIVINNLNIEFVGARKESYNSNSRNPTVTTGTFEDDQIRRDFTINTLAVNVNDLDIIINNFNGLEDIKNKVIKTPQNPDITFFDDPLRILRAVRFATQLNFNIEQNTLSSLSKNIDRLGIISKERIAEELNKIILSPKPSVGLFILQESNILQMLLPELINLKGVENIEGIKHKDNFFHSLQVLDNISLNTNNVWLRWAALLHDIGKFYSKKFDNLNGWTFHGHEVISSKMINKIFIRLGLPLNEKMDYVKKIIYLHHRPISLSKDEITDSAIRRLLFEAGEDIDDLMILCEADITSKNETKVKKYLNNFNLVREKIIIVEKKDKLRNWKPAISGEIIMQHFKLKPSKTVGIIKEAIKEAILDGHINNNFEESKQFMIEFAKNNLGII